MTDVAHWLDTLGLSRYAPAFEENALEMEHLPELDHDTLKELGIQSLGHRLTILKAARTLDFSDAALPATTPHPPSEPNAPEAERRQLTVMFCDLVGSVALGETMDLEDYRELLANFRRATVDAVSRHHGYIARHQGDGLLVYFGYPAAHENDAIRSVRAGLQIVAAVKKLNLGNDADLSVRVGIATGLVVVGDVLATTSSTKSEHAAFGATPNLAARLQGQAEPDTVLISATTYNLVANTFQSSAARDLTLKGMSQSVQAYQIYSELETSRSGRFGEIWIEDTASLVGRDNELRHLTDRWHATQGSAGQTTLVSSQPGLGKSRLIRALVAKALESECHIYTFQCSAFHENSTLYPIIDQLSHQARIAFGDSPRARRRKLKTLLKRYLDQSDSKSSAIENLIDQACFTTDTNYQFAQQTEQRLDGLIEILADLTTDKPVLLIIEDIQWADPSTLTLIDQINGRVSQLPVYLVLTHRGTSSLEFSTPEHVQTISLNPLGREDSEAVVTNTAQEVQLDQKTVAKICERSDGIPLYLKEITMGVVQTYKEQERNMPTGSNPAHLLLASIPERLQDSLMARLDRLGPAKLVAQLGAVVGRQFEHGIISELLSRSSEQVTELLSQLLLSDLITAQGATPNTVYIFNHALVQEAAYQSLLKPVRSRYHACCAQVLVELFPHVAQTEPERIAHHYSRAKMAVEATDYWAIAARRALSRSAYEESCQSADQGIRLLDDIPDPKARHSFEITLCNTIGHATDMSKGFGRKDARDTFNRALELGKQTSNDAELFLTLLGIWRGTIARSDLNQAQATGEQLLQVARTISSPVPTIVAHMTIANTKFHIGDFNSALVQVERGLAIYHPDQRNQIGAPMFTVGQDPVVSLEYCGALSSWLLGNHTEAQRYNDRGLTLARELNQPYTLSMALVWTNILYLFAEQWDRSIALADELVEISEAYALPWSLGMGLSIRGWIKLKGSMAEPGMEELHKGISILEEMKESSFNYYAFGLLADGYRITGKVDAGLAMVERSIDWFTTSGMNWDAPYMLRLQGRLALMNNDESLAESSFRRSIKYSRDLSMVIHEIDSSLLLADLLHSTSRTSEAIELLKGCPLPDHSDHRAKVKIVYDAMAALQPDGSD